MIKWYIHFVAIISIVLFTACRHKDFCLHHPHGDIYLEVVYDDDNDPDDRTFLDNFLFATRIMAYHMHSEEMVLASDIGLEPYRLILDTDTYHFIAYNSGTQSINFFNGESFYSHAVNTRECDILEPLYRSRATKSDIDLGNGEKIVIGAEPIWAAGLESAICNLGDTVRLTAVPLHCRYSFEMRNVEGLGGVSRVSAFITGMSHGAFLSSADLHDVPVTVAVPASIGKDGKSVVGSFFCFGHNPRLDAPHRMGLFIEMESGKRYKLLEGDHFDVSSQVVNAPNRRRVHIVIDGIKLPPPDVNSGFEVTLDPWNNGENLEIDYKM